MKGLTMRLAVMETDGKPKALVVTPETGEAEMKDILDKVGETIRAGRRARIMEIFFQGNLEIPIESFISEKWSAKILFDYANACRQYGESFFIFCEAVNSRKCLERYDHGNFRKYDTLAEAGKYVAETFLGVQKGIIKYLQARELAQDILEGKAPEELPKGIFMGSAPGGEPVYVFGCEAPKMASKLSPRPAGF